MGLPAVLPGSIFVSEVDEIDRCVVEGSGVCVVIAKTPDRLVCASAPGSPRLYLVADLIVHMTRYGCKQKLNFTVDAR